MATYTATAAEAKAPAHSSGWSATKYTSRGQIRLTTLLAANDVIKVCKLPRGAVVVGGTLRGSKLASGATQASQSMVLNFGVDVSVKSVLTGTATTTLSTSTALGASMIPNAACVAEQNDAGYNWPLGGLLVTDGHGPFELEDDGTVYITVVASAGAGSFVSGTIYLDIDYYLNRHS